MNLIFFRCLTFMFKCKVKFSPKVFHNLELLYMAKLNRLSTLRIVYVENFIKKSLLEPEI